MRNILIFGLVLVGTLSAGTISVTPPATTIAQGQAFTLSVDVGGISDLYAFQVDLVFDPTELTVTNVTEGALFAGLGVAFSPGIIDDGVGTVSFIADSLPGPSPGVSGSGTLATIYFQALAEGGSLVEFSNIILLNSSLEDITADASGAIVTVTPSTGVPEPGTVVLVASVLGLAGALRLLRRR